MRKMLKVTMPPRLGAKSGAKRWSLWLVFAFAGVVSAVLMKRRAA